MSENAGLEIFLVTINGLEETLRLEAVEQGFDVSLVEAGGVTVRGDWTEVWRANLTLRCATRVLVRIAMFRAMHLAQLDRRARRVDWAALIPADVPVKVDATTKKSKIYHAGAASERVERAIRDGIGGEAERKSAHGPPLGVKVRLDDDLCTISIDVTGEPLHRRGHKQEVNKAPLRETLAAAFLRQCGFTGTESVVDPMCGSGTFVIEAAEIAAGYLPGRSRSFTFQRLKTFDQDRFASMSLLPKRSTADVHVWGSDRDAGAVRMSQANAERADVQALTTFQHHAISDLQAPDSAPGLVIVNPPYGGRLGNKRLLRNLYGAFGATMRARFTGWRVGLVTTDPALAQATGLPFGKPGPQISHGGMRIRLYQTRPLP